MAWLFTLFSFVVSAWLTWRFIKPTSRFYIVDYPNKRSLHTQPTPRSGGIAILAAVVIGSFFQVWWSNEQDGIVLWIGLALLVVATVSFLDDRSDVPVAYRLVAHVVGAILLLLGGLSSYTVVLPGIDWILPVWSGNIMSLLFVVWMINVYNFMDGMDGFAGGMAVSGFGTFAVLGLLAGATLFSLLNMVVASAALGFLVFNFPPARVFMGDVGSSMLGFLAAAMSLWAEHERLFPLWIAVLVFSPFVVDASVTLIRRLLRGEKPWQAHKTHYYQSLVQSGWGHRRTVLLEYIVMLGCGASALWAVRLPEQAQLMLLTGWALFYAVFFFWVSRLSVAGRT